MIDLSRSLTLCALTNLNTVPMQLPFWTHALPPEARGQEVCTIHTGGRIHTTCVGHAQASPNWNLSLIGSGGMNGWIGDPVWLYSCVLIALIWDKETHKCFEQVLVYKLAGTYHAFICKNHPGRWVNFWRASKKAYYITSRPVLTDLIIVRSLPTLLPICLSVLHDWHKSQGLGHSIDYWCLGSQGGLSSPKTSHLPAKDLTITSVGILHTENSWGREGGTGAFSWLSDSSMRQLMEKVHFLPQ